MRAERASSEGLRQLRSWRGTVGREKPGRTGKSSEAYGGTGFFAPEGERVDNGSARGSTKLGGSDLAVGNGEVRGEGKRGTSSGKGWGQGRGWSLPMRSGLSGDLGKGAASSQIVGTSNVASKQVLLHVTFDQLKPQANLAEISHL